MNKKELVAYLAENMEVSKSQTEILLGEIFGGISELLVKGETVSIPKFGKFEVTESAARKGRNPQTGEEIDIPAKNRVKFKVSKNLKESV